MLFFRSEEQIEAWCAATGEPHGEVLPLAQVWELSKPWYGDRMSPTYRGKSTAELLAILESVGLTSSFWNPNA